MVDLRTPLQQSQCHEDEKGRHGEPGQPTPASMLDDFSFGFRLAGDLRRVAQLQKRLALENGIGPSRFFERQSRFAYVQKSRAIATSIARGGVLQTKPFANVLGWRDRSHALQAGCFRRDSRWNT